VSSLAIELCLLSVAGLGRVKDWGDQAGDRDIEANENERVTCSSLSLLSMNHQVLYSIGYENSTLIPSKGYIMLCKNPSRPLFPRW